MNDEIAGHVGDAPDPGAPDVRRRPARRLRKVLTGAGIAVGVIILATLLLYSFGTMQPPSAQARSAYAQAVAAGQAPAIQGRFGIPIPGCVCHSDDPALQMQHSVRRLSQCGGCHQRG